MSTTPTCSAALLQKFSDAMSSSPVFCLLFSSWSRFHISGSSQIHTVSYILLLEQVPHLRVILDTNSQFSSPPGAGSTSQGHPRYKQLVLFSSQSRFHISGSSQIQTVNSFLVLEQVFHLRAILDTHSQFSSLSGAGLKY